MPTGLTGRLVTKSSQLNCPSFGEDCRFGNAPGSPINWLKGEGLIDAQKWQKATGSLKVPSKTFTLQYLWSCQLDVYLLFSKSIRYGEGCQTEWRRTCIQYHDKRPYPLSGWKRNPNIKV